jgi:transcriptional regulator with XRE-family HTH domain
MGRYLQHLRTSGERESIRAVSASTGLSTGYLSKIENGGVKGPPGLAILRKLADHYKIGLDSLLVLSGAEAPQEQGEPQDLDQAFLRLITQAGLRPDGLRDEELRWFAPQVKRHWLNFSRNLLQAVRDGTVDPEALLAATEISS